MEVAPLTAAHSLARNAFAAKDVPASSQHHDAAADKFAEAAVETEDPEAVRILKLLEEHHHQLARIIKSQPELASTEEAVPVDQRRKDSCAPSTPSSPSEVNQQSPSQGSAPSVRPVSPGTSRRPKRELSSSIANNLASARGIPSVQQRGARTTARQSLEAASAALARDKKSASQGSIPAISTARLSSQSADPVSAASEQAGQQSEQPHPASNTASSDDAFRKFYSGFEGLLTKLSAPLAFAGLPLVPEASSTSEPGGPLNDNVDKRKSAPAAESPEVSNIFSKAALRAARENNGGNGGVHESFYVVPTGGGTVSYAGMLTNEGRRRSSLVSNDGMDGDGAERFVDAHETPQSPRSRAAKGIPSQRSPNTNKTFEELEVENASLKQLTDNLSRRLYMWEKSAQSQGFALQQSMRLLHQHSPENSNDGKSAAKDNRLAELEEQIRVMQKELDKHVRENEKLKTVVARYRERWEKLKEGARRRESSGAAGKGGAVESAPKDD